MSHAVRLHHVAKTVGGRRRTCYLPPYSPHLNIAEVLWRKLKYEWLGPEDYADADILHYQVWLALEAVGQSLSICFSPLRKTSGLKQN